MSGNILLKVGDELGFDVVKSLSFPEALKLINDLTVAVINRYAKWVLLILHYPLLNIEKEKSKLFIKI